jgi:hypothetical protein
VEDGRRADRSDTAWEVKSFTGGSRPRVRRILKKIRKRLATVLAGLGRWERLILICIQERGLGYQFRIADIVTCIVETYKIPKRNGQLNRKLHSAVTRLVKRGIIIKKARGIYALRKDLARISALGYPLVGEAVFPPLKDMENRYKALRETVKNHVTFPSKNKENLSAAARHGSGIGDDSIISNSTCNSDIITDGNTSSSTDSGTSISSDKISTPNEVGSDFVIRAHAINPYGGWIGYYISVSVGYYVLGFARSIIREYLAELYGESFVHKLDESTEAVAKSLPGARFIDGCHGRYGTSPGSFSPLTPRCEVHSYEYGVDVILPAALSDVLRYVSFIKIYVKEINTNGYPREAQYRTNDIRKFL